MNTDQNLEDLMGQLGVFGKYQYKQHALHIITAFLAGMHMLSLTFVAPTPPHRCLIPELDLHQMNGTTNITAALQLSPTFDKEILSEYIPRKGAGGELDSCRRYQFDTFLPFDDGEATDSSSNRTPSLSTVSCDGQFVYDTSIYLQSRVYDWNMVCEQKWKRAFIQSIYVFGVLVGAVMAGTFADKYGRKPVLCVSAVLQFTFAMMGPFLQNYTMYCLSLFFYGMFGSGGAFVTGFVLSTELVNKRYRAVFGALFCGFFAVGVCFVALWSYLIRDITILQSVFAAHALLLFGHFWLLDESIRWLWGQGRIREAVKITREAVRTNGGSFDNKNFEKGMLSTTQNRSRDKSYGLKDLFQTTSLRWRVIKTAFIWFATSLCLYGLAFNTGVLPGNPYLVFFISGFMDIPGKLFVALLVNHTGRRPLLVSLLFFGGAACVTIAFIPRGLIVTSLAMIAKAALAGGFGVLYNYSAELFPTVIRNSAIGICSMSARVGGALTPQITLLDSLDKMVPTIVFGCMAIAASLVALFLPETLNKELPQSLEDGENFGKGDTAFTLCCTGSPKKGKLTQLPTTLDVECGKMLKQ